MKKLSLIVSLFIGIALSSCVNRTIISEPAHRNLLPGNKKYGADPHSRVIEKKRVWVWEKEFRDPN